MPHGSAAARLCPLSPTCAGGATELAQAEVEHALNRRGEIGSEEREAIERLAHRLVNKLLHPPTMALRRQAEQGNGYGYAHVVRELFDLADSDYQLTGSRRPTGAAPSPSARSFIFRGRPVVTEDSIRIGSRGSDLALWQSRHVADLLHAATPPSPLRSGSSQHVVMKCWIHRSR